jgi:PIN domain nuclease of toxin-antitoxin system
MNCLLDTHTFIWADSEPARLSSRAAALIQDPDNTILVSVASLWEMQIKLQAGKLTLRLPLPGIVEHQHKNNRIELLPIMLPHVLALDGLPLHHKDPFDRILIAQAHVEKLTLLSHDSIFVQYGVTVVW